MDKQQGTAARRGPEQVPPHAGQQATPPGNPGAGELAEPVLQEQQGAPVRRNGRGVEGGPGERPPGGSRSQFSRGACRRFDFYSQLF